MITERGQLMTLMVFLGVLVSLLILRLVPGLLLRLVLAIPRHRLAASMGWLRARRIEIALSRKSTRALADAAITSRRAHPGRLKLVLVSSSLVVLAALVTTAFWTWHSTGLMMLLQ
jgi:uncharacterized protein YjiS (DUF1127 family)